MRCGDDVEDMKRGEIVARLSQLVDFSDHVMQKVGRTSGLRDNLSMK